MKQMIVVGSGIAGLIAALELSKKYPVTLVTKARLSESNTRYAQGGIAAAMSSDDSIAEHIADTMQAGASLSDLAAVEVLCAEGPARIHDLIALGVEFDQRNGELARGLEAAHSRARVLHAGGDATGLAIENALVDAVRAAGVQVFENTFACELVLQDGHISALEILNVAGECELLPAHAIVLASGGAGQLFTYTTNPAVATGDGVAMALRAGALLADVEFYQFHPTALAIPGNFLLSEAVRGDGAVLRDKDGNRFMQRVHASAELAPRDVVARGIAEQMAAQGGQPVLLDATSMGAAFLASRFPTIDAACRKAGLDWSKEPVPVTPAAHYWMGGVKTDLWGRTSIPGLFAVGEVACTGVHGANRLASNSLLESIVFSWRAAHLLLDDENCVKPGKWPVLNWVANLHAPQWPRNESNLEEISRKDLQQLMWTHAGIYRDERGLREAMDRLIHAQSSGSSVHALETQNLLTIAGALVTSALERRESRGAHFRSDFPETSLSFQHQLIIGRTEANLCKAS
jgi:L-aspartate oxidase